MISPSVVAVAVAAAVGTEAQTATGKTSAIEVAVAVEAAVVGDEVGVVMIGTGGTIGDAIVSVTGHSRMSLAGIHAVLGSTIASITGVLVLQGMVLRPHPRPPWVDQDQFLLLAVTAAPHHRCFLPPSRSHLQLFR